MIELGELERQQAEFSGRHVKVVAASVDGLEDSQKTQNRFPHLVIVSDASLGMTRAAEVVHAHTGPKGNDIAIPTTFLMDSQGTVRWVFRPSGVATRLSPSEVLDAVERYLPAGR